jgi:succinate-semialdehyde dehydrogenase/glutarate-semialdehyde dehydrogenase
MICSTNPATGAELARYDEHSDAHVELTLSAAAQAQHHWASLDIASRAAILQPLLATARATRAICAPHHAGNG